MLNSTKKLKEKKKKLKLFIVYYIEFPVFYTFITYSTIDYSRKLPSTVYNRYYIAFMKSTWIRGPVVKVPSSIPSEGKVAKIAYHC